MERASTQHVRLHMRVTFGASFTRLVDVRQFQVLRYGFQPGQRKAVRQHAHSPVLDSNHLEHGWLRCGNHPTQAGRHRCSVRSLLRAAPRADSIQKPMLLAAVARRHAEETDASCEERTRDVTRTLQTPMSLCASLSHSRVWCSASVAQRPRRACAREARHEILLRAAISFHDCPTASNVVFPAVSFTTTSRVVVLLTQRRRSSAAWVLASAVRTGDVRHLECHPGAPG